MTKKPEGGWYEAPRFPPRDAWPEPGVQIATVIISLTVIGIVVFMGGVILFT